MEAFIPKHLAFQTSQAKKKAGVQCCAYGCKSLPIYKLGGLCYKHYQIKVRIKDPVYNRYMNFRGNAKKRPWKGGIGIPFTITLTEFREFCEQTGYIVQKGKRGRNCTIDRLENDEGYHIWNIGIKSNQANVKKYHHEDKHKTVVLTEADDDCPF